MRLAILGVLLVASTAHALPPKEHGRGFRDGANHHLGDDSFVALHHRAPDPSDSERERMHDHLAYAHDWLASRPATSPALAARRAELLGYLADYIARGTTPVNTYVPWRSPVFIDARGTICAVGYLIERTAGRPAAEQIAAHHRLAFLEDIAAAEPSVRLWIHESGFTTDELASIQPGYEGPDVQFQNGWDPEQLAATPDGPYAVDDGPVRVTGAFARGRMTGDWTVTDLETKAVVGRGHFANGRGTWRSQSIDGAKLAEGPFADNRATGTWRFYHPSGRLAAEGSFHRGVRDGAWRFYYDAPGAQVISEGSFWKGSIAGTWRHFDAAGKLLARAGAAPKRGGGPWINDALFLRVTADRDGVVHEVHEGIPASGARLDGYYRGAERLYVAEDGARYDADGNRLEPEGSHWFARDCHWPARRKRAAHAGDLVTIHSLLLRAGHDDETIPAESCGDRVQLSDARARQIDRVLLAQTAVRAPTPAFVQSYLDAPDDDDATPDATVPPLEPAPPPHASERADLATVLAAHMTWYMEFPHVDGPFRRVFATLPGYRTARG